ncbi:Amidase [Dictyocaulus viviparus]|uniref:Amidase n=1 Tax=Dictyocaulus viviparus TaxID=29172 RepID=A0A0D8XX68_DICVI|nr:Amidase [Dictyocaulus viviparus]
MEVLRTYQWKAIKAHEKTNCVVMFIKSKRRIFLIHTQNDLKVVIIFIKEAEEWASEWDNKAKQKDFVKPTFFGIPISLKECVPLAGYDQTRGFVQDVNSPTKIDSVLVEQVKKLGTTSNYLDVTRTPGGSSGGEAALIAAGGSIIGIGGDVGGSIRIPCHFTGIAGIKPSHLRFSHRGVCGSVPGRPLINSSDGPMTRDIKTTIDFLREVWRDNWISAQDPYVPPVIWNEHLYTKGNVFRIGFYVDDGWFTPIPAIQVWRDNWISAQDPYVPPVIWNEHLYTKGNVFRIGFYVDDGWFTPIPAIQRSVLESKKHLEAAGHIVIPFQPPSIPITMRYFLRAVTVDGGHFLLNKLFNDIIDPTLYGQVMMLMVPIRLQRLLAYPFKFVFPRLANLMHSMAMDTSDLRQTYADIEDYRHDFIKLMREKNLDAILCPPQVMVAPQHHVPSRLFSACSYTALFNLLDFGAGVVKVTNVTEDDEQKMLNDYPETDLWYKMVKNTCKNCIGYPVGVQVAAPPYKEEVVLRILRDIEIAVEEKSGC